LILSQQMLDQHSSSQNVASEQGSPTPADWCMHARRKSSRPQIQHSYQVSGSSSNLKMALLHHAANPIIAKPITAPDGNSSRMESKTPLSHFVKSLLALFAWSPSPFLNQEGTGLF